MNELTEVKRLFELLNNELTAVISYAEKISEDKKAISDEGEILKAKLQSAEAKEANLKEEKNAIGFEKASLGKRSGEVEMKIQSLKSLQSQMEEKNKQLAEKEAEIKTLSEQLEVKIKTAGSVDEMVQELKYQRALLEKEKGVDRERREMLDMREKKIKDREEQLQKMASSL